MKIKSIIWLMIFCIIGYIFLMITPSKYIYTDGVVDDKSILVTIIYMIIWIGLSFIAGYYRRAEIFYAAILFCSLSSIGLLLLSKFDMGILAIFTSLWLVPFWQLFNRFNGCYWITPIVVISQPLLFIIGYLSGNIVNKKTERKAS